MEQLYMTITNYQKLLKEGFDPASKEKLLAFLTEVAIYQADFFKEDGDLFRSATAKDFTAKMSGLFSTLKNMAEALGLDFSLFILMENTSFGAHAAGKKIEPPINIVYKECIIEYNV